MKYLTLIACILTAAHFAPPVIERLSRWIDTLGHMETEIRTIQTKIGDIKLHLNYCVTPCARKAA